MFAVWFRGRGGFLVRDWFGYLWGHRRQRREVRTCRPRRWRAPDDGIYCIQTVPKMIHTLAHGIENLTQLAVYALRMTGTHRLKILQSAVKIQ